MKKLIALLLALVMVLSLVACTAKEEPEKEEEKPADSEQKPAEDKKEEDKKEEEKEEEKEETPAEYVPGTLPLVTEPTTITVGLAQNANTEDYDNNEYTLWFEEQTGVDLEFVYFSADATEAVTQLNLMITGGQELPDILWAMTAVNDALRAELGADGYFLDLNPYFEEEAYWFWEGYNTMPSQTDKDLLFALGTDPTSGAFYGYPEYQQGSGYDNFRCCMYINQEWLKAVEMDMPTNVDELYEVLKAFATEDPNGNGVADELPLIGSSKTNRCDPALAVLNAYIFVNDDNFFNVENGQLYVPYTTDEYREGLRYLNKLYEEGLLSPITYTMDGYTEMMGLLSPADEVATVGVVACHPTLAFEKDHPTMFEYAGMPPMADETGKGGYAPKNKNTFRYSSFVTCDAEDPALAFRVIDFMASWESTMRQRYGVYGRDWTDAAEGATNSTGYPAFIEVLDQSVFSQQNNISWHVVGPCVLHNDNWATTWTNDGSWSSDRELLHWEAGNAHTAAGLPEEVILALVYNAEEQEVVSEYKTLVVDFVKSQRALFISGNLDIDSDADWEAYIQNLEDQGLNEWLEVSQSAYTRMFG